MKEQGKNPYLPSWEYIPDGEPYVFGDRIYVYGSHDKFNGYAYCLNDYVCWSAPVEDLGDWRNEGVILRAEDVEGNKDRDSCLYAPDVVVGFDNRYYLYYVDSKQSIVSVAVSDTPAGYYKFYGYVTYSNGIALGIGVNDEPQFDPAVLKENGVIYLYTGFCGRGDTSRSGAMVTVLDKDMITIVEKTKVIIPSEAYGKGTMYEGYEFFEAPSIRKVKDKYYFIYSSISMHELCYAISAYPDRDFVFGGVIISNCDLHIDSYKPKNKPMYYGGNNHGSIVQIGESWFVFYHRHTNGTNFSRQGCLERIHMDDYGKIAQVEMTSCQGINTPLVGKGTYYTYIACNLLCNEESIYTDFSGAWMNNQFPKITQDGKDGDQEMGYVCNMKDGAVVGFKYFDIKNINKIAITTRGYAQGVIQLMLKYDAEVIGEIPIHFSNVWKTYEENIKLVDGVNSIYFKFKGKGSVSFSSFTFIE